MFCEKKVSSHITRKESSHKAVIFWSSLLQDVIDNKLERFTKHWAFKKTKRMLQRLIAYCHKRGACKGVLTLMLWQIILFCFAASFSEVVGLKKKKAPHGFWRSSTLDYYFFLILCLFVCLFFSKAGGVQIPDISPFCQDSTKFIKP